jgi:hypothetical protein
MSCSTQVKGMPAFDCRTGNNYGLLKGCIFVSPDFSIALSSAAIKSNWIAQMIASKAYPVHNFVNVEDASKAEDVMEFALGGKKTLQDALRGFKATLNLTLDAHKILNSYQNAFSHAIFYDTVGNLMGKTDGTNLLGIKLSTLEVHAMSYGLPGAAPLSSFTVVEENAGDWNENGVTIMPYNNTVATRWMPQDLSSITTVTPAQSGTITSNSYIVDVAFKSTSDIYQAGDYVVNKPVTGLVAANFQSKSGAGVIVAITSATESLSLIHI